MTRSKFRRLAIAKRRANLRANGLLRYRLRREREMVDLIRARCAWPLATSH